MRLIPVLLALALTGCATPPPAQLTVTGQAEVQVVPDRVCVSCGVVTRDADPKKALAANEQIVKRALETARGAGVEPADLHTDVVSLSEWTDNRGSHLGYEATCELTARSKDLAHVDKLLSGLVQAGINRIDSVSIESSEMPKYRAQAREGAIKAAREKASAMAGALGQSIGKAMQIEEEGAPDMGGPVKPEGRRA